LYYACNINEVRRGYEWATRCIGMNQTGEANFVRQG
jgi:hypothetical protein